ncbi:MAG: hypothetical protein IKM64_04810, partial [Clostridia bacterium]|nr:hypothetical protein [Clostridia bacterium]
MRIASCAMIPFFRKRSNERRAEICREGGGLIDFPSHFLYNNNRYLCQFRRMKRREDFHEDPAGTFDQEVSQPQ